MITMHTYLVMTFLTAFILSATGNAVPIRRPLVQPENRGNQADMIRDEHGRGVLASAFRESVCTLRKPNGEPVFKTELEFAECLMSFVVKPAVQKCYEQEKGHMEATIWARADRGQPALPFFMRNGQAAQDSDEYAADQCHTEGQLLACVVAEGKKEIEIPDYQRVGKKALVGGAPAQICPNAPTFPGEFRQQWTFLVNWVINDSKERLQTIRQNGGAAANQLTNLEGVYTAFETERSLNELFLPQRNGFNPNLGIKKFLLPMQAVPAPMGLPIAPAGRAAPVNPAPNNNGHD